MMLLEVQIESENYDFLMYALKMLDNQCHPYMPSTTVLGD